MYQETEKIELKRELTDDVKKEIIAFLNASGGTIFVGVEDDGTVVGITDDKQKDNIDLKLGNWLQDAIAPTPLNLVAFKFNDDNVLEINVQEGNHKPYYLADKGLKPTSTYVRVGRSKRNATEEQIKRMLLRTFDFSYEENISKEQDLTFIEFARAFTDDGFQLNERSMVTLGIKNLDGQFTNLGYLFSDQSKLTVKIADMTQLTTLRLSKLSLGRSQRLLRIHKSWLNG